MVRRRMVTNIYIHKVSMEVMKSGSDDGGSDETDMQLTSRLRHLSPSSTHCTAESKDIETCIMANNKVAVTMASVFRQTSK